MLPELLQVIVAAHHRIRVYLILGAHFPDGGDTAVRPPFSRQYVFTDTVGYLKIYRHIVIELHGKHLLKI